MFKSALSYVGNILPLRLVEGGLETAGEEKKSLKKDWARLVESDFEVRRLRTFASEYRAQELPTEVFAALLAAGDKSAASFFFERDPQKGDQLSPEKVDLLLDTPGLAFASRDNGEFMVVEDAVERALRLLIGYADIQPRGLARLLLHRDCALVMLAIWTQEVLADEVLCQVTATAGNYRSCDVKAFCANPSTYSNLDGLSIPDTDLFLIRIISQHPARVFEILRK